MTRLTIQAFDGTTRLRDPYNTLREYTNLQYDTGYPGGQFLRCSFRLPLLAPRKIPFIQGHVIKVKLDADTVWEGVVQDIVWHDAIDIACIGWWGHLLMRRHWNKNWADSRIDDQAWVYQESTSGADKGFVDRNDRIRFTPKSEAWANTEYMAVRYTAPTGTNIAFIQYDYDFAEPAGTWTQTVYDVDNASTVKTYSATASGSDTHTFSPVTTTIEFRYTSGAAQTPASNGTYYAEFSGITVFAEFEGTSPTVAEGTLNIYELCLDTIDKLSGELSASIYRLDSTLTSDIDPFVSNDAEPISSILMRAATTGDTSLNPIAVGLKESDLAADGLPILFAETYAQTTDYDYTLNWNEENRVGGSMAESIQDLANYIYVSYINTRGHQAVVGPDDNANLTDSQSSGEAWGQIDKIINSRSTQTDEAGAVLVGRRYLAHFKDRQWYMARPLQVEKFLYSKRGQKIPAAKVRAGQRLKVSNFSGTNEKVFVITHARYDAERERVSITAGRPPFLLDGRLIKR